MTASSALLAGRVAAERLMLDTCTIHDGSGGFDPESGEPTLGEPIYSGRCKVATYEPYERNPEAAGGTLTIQRYSVHVPVARTETDYRPDEGHVVTITAAESDPHLVGREYRVVALLHKSHATAYRLGVEEA